VLKESGERGSGTMSATQPSDAEARLRIVLARRLPDGWTRSLSIADDDAEGRIGEVTSVNLTRDFPPGETDVGDVRLSTGGIVVSGIVVDGESQPVPGATVRLATVRRSAGSGSSYAQATALEATSDEAGRFEVRGDGVAGAIEVKARKPGYLASEPASVSPGQGGITLVVHRDAVIGGSVLLGASVRRQDVRVLLEPVPAEATVSPRDRFRRETAPGENGTFLWNQLRAGTYAFSLRLLGESAPPWRSGTSSPTRAISRAIRACRTSTCAEGSVRSR
jgi:hypothetical protein